jgi:hypothetical protein
VAWSLKVYAKAPASFTKKVYKDEYLTHVKDKLEDELLVDRAHSRFINTPQKIPVSQRQRSGPQESPTIRLDQKKPQWRISSNNGRFE